MAKAASWTFRESAAGWGSHEAMLTAIEKAISGGPYLLGDTFTMADVIFGGTVRYMLGFKMLEPRATFTAYSERLAQRPAFQRAEARNAKVSEDNGLKR
jgi:glutathione S-transferase